MTEDQVREARRCIEAAIRATFAADVAIAPDDPEPYSTADEWLLAQWETGEAELKKAAALLPSVNGIAKSRYPRYARKRFGIALDMLEAVRDCQKHLWDAPELAAIEVAVALRELPALQETWCWWRAPEGIAESKRLDEEAKEKVTLWLADAGVRSKGSERGG